MLGTSFIHIYVLYTHKNMIIFQLWCFKLKSTEKPLVVQTVVEGLTFNLISNLGSLETLNFLSKIAIGMLFSLNPSFPTHSLIMLNNMIISMYCCLDLLISSLSKRNIFTKYKFSCITKSKVLSFSELQMFCGLSECFKSTLVTGLTN